MSDRSDAAIRAIEAQQPAERIADRDPDKAGKLREAVKAAAGRMLA